MLNARQQREPLVRPGEIDHQIADMTATMSTDVTLGHAQTKLAAVGQWIPIDDDPDSTLGRLVQRNSTGPLRLGYGAWRDLLLGAQFRNGAGELITAGGRTMKNVAGYDLTKFMVGQGGVFGTLVTLTSRTYKRPTGAVLATFDSDTLLVNRLMPTDLRPQWMILSSDQLLVGYVGDERTADWYASRLPELGPRTIERRTIDQDIAHRRELWNVMAERVFRAALPPAKIKQFTATLPAGGWVADPAFGLVLGQWSDKHPIREAAKGLSGVVTFFDGDEFDFEPDQPAQRALLERLKLSFDPDAQLAPLPWRK